jgi:hypothetical protein
MPQTNQHTSVLWHMLVSYLHQSAPAKIVYSRVHEYTAYTRSHQHANPNPLGRCAYRNDEQVRTRRSRPRHCCTVRRCMPVNPLCPIFAALGFLPTSAASQVASSDISAAFGVADVTASIEVCMASTVGAVYVHPPRVQCHPVKVCIEGILEAAEPTGAHAHSPAVGELVASCREGGVACHRQSAKSSRPTWTKKNTGGKVMKCGDTGGRTSGVAHSNLRSLAAPPVNDGEC